MCRDGGIGGEIEKVFEGDIVGETDRIKTESPERENTDLPNPLQSCAADEGECGKEDGGLGHIEEECGEYVCGL